MASYTEYFTDSPLNKRGHRFAELLSGIPDFEIYPRQKYCIVFAEAPSGLVFALFFIMPTMAS